jgi:hypothetical protein
MIRYYWREPAWQRLNGTDDELPCTKSKTRVLPGNSGLFSSSTDEPAFITVDWNRRWEIYPQSLNFLIHRPEIESGVDPLFPTRWAKPNSSRATRSWGTSNQASLPTSAALQTQAARI